MTSLTQQLVDYIRNKPISENDLQRTALLVLDAVATAYAGAATPVGRKLIAWSTTQELNDRTRAFLMAALTHITETDDLHRASATHPGCVVVPCVLTLAQRRDVSSRSVLEATLRGFEAMCRIGNAVGPAHYKIWHNTATCGPFGSAMAAAELLELSESQTVNALGNAGTQSSGLWQFLESGAMSKHLHAGRGCEAGLLSAELAQFDFTGPAEILEGQKGFFVGLCPDPQPERVLAQSAAPWQVMLTSIKPWPSCRQTHPSVDAALEIHAKLDNNVIERVCVETYDAAVDICDRVKPSNEYQAKFSLQHCVAKALSEGELALHSFTEKARLETEQLCQRIEVSSKNPFKHRYPEAWGARVSIETSSGNKLDAEREHCKGDPERMLNEQEMLDKAKMLMQFAGLPTAKINAICSEVLSMAELNTPTSISRDFMAHIENINAQ